jgi:dipeptidyl aminopeptidase/acylaminoacyl peptidase
MPAQTPAGASVPPLIDRELFFGNPEISGAQLSPDGLHIAFVKPHNGTRNIWVKSLSEPYSAARLATNDTKRAISNYFWSKDSKYILFVQDDAGDENFNVFAVDPSAPPVPGSEVPTARNLTAAKGARAFIYDMPKADPNVIWVGLNDRDPAWHDLYKVDIASGQRALVRENTEKISSWLFDHNGEPRLASRTLDNGDTEVLRVEGDALKSIYTCSVFESCDLLRFHKDGTRVYISTNKGATDLQVLVLLDPATGQETSVESDPEKRVDFGYAKFSELTDELLATAYYDERTRTYFHDRAFEADYRLVENRLPGADIAVVSATADEQLWLVVASSDREPGQRYLFDRRTKVLTLQYTVFETLPRQGLASMTAITYPSSDATPIPAFLMLPVGVPATNLPTVVLPHGGPWARNSWGWDAAAQFLANRGYAVLQPNFRGSTGYGKQFLNAGNKEWGDKMQDDLTWGVKHLVGKGITDPKRVAIMGVSYGGYATLAGVAFTPDIYTAGISIVGPSNLITLLDSVPPYWEAARKLFDERIGNPAVAADRARLVRQSPLSAVDRIRTPLLVIQGANDPRVKKAESDQIVIALRDRGCSVEYLVAPDEGHGFARPVNNIGMYATAEKFLARHLCGRFQASITPEVAKRLGEISVDPKTMTISTAAGTSAPASKP